ncbi:anaerobic sulfatase maturase [Vibrio sp. Y2-5]|uniref:anaerobic sulfatase maturase n=1 Tax=Vibrio sp. Y2-5 TaxID=2743977 RepID=UPI001660C3CF|nr:anaerobic sulfatase maturase [Vibrio sp. Y2-5]MBD0785925.1 anaerobic sulfatase maturase [Vibrio sp. Y2-5]
MTTFNLLDVESPKLQLPKLTHDMYRFHAVSKPAASRCNLDCSYCFYLHKQTLLEQSVHANMSEEVLARYIQQYVEAHTGEEVVFTWQGGEPTLIGLEFYQKVVSYQARFKKPNQTILNDLQTNGILLNDEWCEFLKKHNFLVGISIDGPKALHDKHRVNRAGKSSFGKVMAAIERLKRHQIPFNALCVVNQDNGAHPLEVYRFLRDEVAANVIQFIPCVEPSDFTKTAPQTWRGEQLIQLGETNSRSSHILPAGLTDWSVGSVQWGEFLTTIWDEWFNQDFGQVFIDQFENVISQLFGFGVQKCVSAEFCGKAVAIEHNGDIYSCDHFVYPQYRLGNIADTHIGDLVFSDKQKGFGRSKTANLPSDCRQCFFLSLCFGECPKNRFTKAANGEPGLNYLCSGLKKFYSKVVNHQAALQRRLSF